MRGGWDYFGVGYDEAAGEVDVYVRVGLPTCIAPFELRWAESFHGDMDPRLLEAKEIRVPTGAYTNAVGLETSNSRAGCVLRDSCLCR